MKSNRVNEIMAAMKSFPKDKYQKEELLPEMLALEREIVGLTYNDDHATTADLKLRDVVNHLEQLNRECGNIAEEEFQRFKDESWTLINLIKAERSGQRGESKAFRALQNIQSENVVLRNVELNDGARRTELDAVVVTLGGVFIVEVKNTSKDAFIDEKGDFYRIGKFQKLNCNIAEKMERKESLLKRALANGGIEEHWIQSIVVFTDNQIEIHNEHSKIKTCFLSQLPYLIDESKSDTNISEDEIERIVNVIREAECKEAYPFEFDVDQYKKDFAILMQVLEEASAKGVLSETEEEAIKEEKVSKKTRAKDLFRRLLTSKFIEYAGTAALGVTVGVLTSTVLSSVGSGGD